VARHPLLELINVGCHSRGCIFSFDVMGGSTAQIGGD
jgi:hypothetical protein